MATIIGNGNITFGDGSIQTTKTPTNVSAFTNDSNYVVNSDVSGVYAPRLSAAVYFYDTKGAKGAMNLYWYNIYGTLQGSSRQSGITANCNCNC